MALNVVRVEYVVEQNSNSVCCARFLFVSIFVVKKKLTAKFAFRDLFVIHCKCENRFCAPKVFVAKWQIGGITLANFFLPIGICVWQNCKRKVHFGKNFK